MNWSMLNQINQILKNKPNKIVVIEIYQPKRQAGRYDVHINLYQQKLQSLVCVTQIICNILRTSLKQNRRDAHMKKWERYCCLEKVNFMLIYEFNYGQTWKKWPSALKFSLYNTFDGCELVEKHSNVLLYCEGFSFTEIDTTTNFCLFRIVKCCSS